MQLFPIDWMCRVHCALQIASSIWNISGETSRLLDDLLERRRWLKILRKNNENYTEFTKWNIKTWMFGNWNGQNNGHKSTEFERQLLWLSQSKFIYGRCHMSYIKSKSAAIQWIRSIRFWCETRKSAIVCVSLEFSGKKNSGTKNSGEELLNVKPTVKTIIVREVQHTHTGCYQHRKFELPQAANDQLRRIDLAKLKRSYWVLIGKSFARHFKRGYIQADTTKLYQGKTAHHQFTRNLQREHWKPLCEVIFNFVSTMN